GARNEARSGNGSAAAKGTRGEVFIPVRGAAYPERCSNDKAVLGAWEARTMYQEVSLRSGTVGALVMVAVLVNGTPPIAAQLPAPDPVQELRDALRVSPHDLGARERNLRQRIAVIRTLADLRSALVLEEWRDNDPEQSLRTVDAAVRSML